MAVSANIHVESYYTRDSSDSMHGRDSVDTQTNKAILGLAVRT